MAEKPEDLIVTDAELRRQLPTLVDELQLGGSGVEEVSGTYALPADGPRLREFYATAATKFTSGQNVLDVPADTALVFRRLASGMWERWRVGVDSGWGPLTPPTPDATPPVAGSLAVTVADVKADLTVTGASDDRGYIQFAFSKDNGTAWTGWQDAATYTFAGLTPSTAYTFRHRVKDGAGNVTTGAAVSRTTQPKSTEPPVRSVIEAAIMADSPHLYLPLQDTGGAVAKKGPGNMTVHHLGDATQGSPMKDGGLGYRYGGTGAITYLDNLDFGSQAAATFEATVEITKAGTIAVGGGVAKDPQLAAGYIGVNGQFAYFTAPLGRVAHIALTYDGATVRGYIDGVEAVTASTTGPVTFGSAGRVNGVQIGGREDGSQVMTGVVRDVAIYKAALPAARILAHAQAQKVV